MLKLRDLATRSDFDIGPLHVSPSTRRVRGPAGETQLEPLIMQALLLLLDADGRVVTRDELFDECWGGALVGDDSLNRAIAGVRRIADVAPGLFEIETIPRTGYRLTGEILDLQSAASTGTGLPLGMSRRMAIGTGAAAVAALGAGGLWWLNRPSSPGRFDALMSRGQEQLSINPALVDADTARTFEQAVALRPDSANAWGLLALVHSLVSQVSDVATASAHASRAERAAGNALAIDPKEPNALLARFELQNAMLGWADRDRTVREILAIDPRNIVAISELVGLLQSAGYNRESWDWNERALVLAPLSPGLLGRRALKLWIAGRVAEADKVIDQVRDWYPDTSFATWIRFLILATTGRPAAANALLESDGGAIGSPQMIAMWRASLKALMERTKASVEEARAACVNAARQSGELAAHAVMILPLLGGVDEAFEVAEGFLLWRGTIVRQGNSGSRIQNDSAWRVGIQWLFTPPCAPMRADPRFLELSRGVGLVDYWNYRRRKPDYQLAG